MQRVAKSMITLGDFGSAAVTAESAQIDKLVLRATGSIRWLSLSVQGGAPVSMLVQMLTGRRSIFGRRMARQFRLVRSNGYDAVRLKLENPPSGDEWCFGIDLQLHSPRASAPDLVTFTLLITLNPTRQLAVTDGRTPRIGSNNSLVPPPAHGEAIGPASNVLPDRMVLQPVADWHWVDAARDVANATFAFVSEQLFGDGVGETPRRAWEVSISLPTISEIECFWEFRDPSPRQTVQQLCTAFTGGAAESGTHNYSTLREGMHLSLSCRLRKSILAVLYPKNNERIRLEIRYGQVSQASLDLTALNLHDKFRAIARNAAKRAGPVLETVTPHLNASLQCATPILYAQLAGGIAGVFYGHRIRVTSVMAELLVEGGITAGDGHLITINEADRLVRAGILSRNKITRSRHGCSFQLETCYIPLCRIVPQDILPS